MIRYVDELSVIFSPLPWHRDRPGLPVLAQPQILRQSHIIGACGDLVTLRLCVVWQVQHLVP